MEGLVVLGLVLAFVVGGLFLALTMAYRSAEQAAAAEAAVPRVQALRAAASVPSVGWAAAGGVDELVLARIESHVKEELALVGAFS